MIADSKTKNSPLIYTDTTDKANTPISYYGLWILILIRDHPRESAVRLFCSPCLRVSVVGVYRRVRGLTTYLSSTRARDSGASTSISTALSLNARFST
jgi:hypothetical protein